jgi:hypothetical protein
VRVKDVRKQGGEGWVCNSDVNERQTCSESYPKPHDNAQGNFNLSHTTALTNFMLSNSWYNFYFIYSFREYTGAWNLIIIFIHHEI